MDHSLQVTSPLWKRWLSHVAVIVLIIGFSVLILLNAERLRALGHYGYVGLFVLSALANATIIVPVPGWLFSLLAGTALNPWLVGLSVGTGEALGELTGYAAGAGGRIIVENRRRYEQISALAQRYGLPFFVLLAFIPNPFFDLLGILAGGLRIPIVRFLLATWLGKTARALLLAFGGYRLLAKLLGL
jgi:membrane protein YqaA with SNARE-associated domain